MMIHQTAQENKKDKGKAATAISALWLKVLTLTACACCFTGSVQAITVDAGEDMTVCVGEMVTLGGSPTVSGGLSPYTYQWTSSQGGNVGSTANPQITVPSPGASGMITYTVKVTDADGFACEDMVVLTVIEVKEINFTPTSLPADGQSTATASAMVVPPSRTVVWSITDNPANCSINPNTGVVTAGNTPGTITVRAADSEKEDCFIEKPLCVGDAEDCCGEIQGSRTFGPITISIPGGIQSQGTDNNGYCSYMANVGVSIEMEGVFEKTASLQGVSVSWKELPNDPSNYKEVTLTWTGDEPLGSFGIIDANITQISLTVTSSGQLSGTNSFKVKQTADKNVGGIAILKKGTTGTFTYQYSSSSSGFAGTWDFGGITGIKIHLQKSGATIAKITVGSLDAQGNLNNARFMAVTPGVYTTNNFTATLENLDLRMNMNIANPQIEFLGGTGRVRISNMTNTQGTFLLNLTFGANSASATVTMDNISAFGCAVSGSVQTDFDYNFDVLSISGSNISAQHNDFDQAFTGVGFEVKSGSLEKFTIGQLSVKYQNALSFSMMGASYVKAQNKLSFSANLTLPSLQVSVTNFDINTNGGVTIGRAKANINQSPVSLALDISYQTDKFSGSFSGQFTGNVGISGSVQIGAQSTFNYGYFSFGVTTPGIPIGATGLKMRTLSGEFGYNWSSPSSQGGSGSPSQGSTTIGFGMGVGDVANLAILEGYVKLNLGAATSIDVSGDVKVRATAPYYFRGSTSVSYTLGSGLLTGSLSSSLNIPPGNGNMVKLNTGNIGFSVGNNEWSINAGGISGEILSAINVTGSINLQSPLNNLFAITGNISGSVTYDNDFSYTYPSGFDPTNCTTADATDNSVGFGIQGMLSVHLGGAINAALDGDGFTGSIQVSASGNSSMSVKWPCFVTCGYECVDTYNTGLSGMLTVERTSSNTTRLHGTASFSYGNETETGDIDFEL